MEEPVKQTVLDLLGEKKPPICQLVVFAKLKSSSDTVLNFFTDYFKNNYVDKISGLLIVYPSCLTLLIESEEEIVFQVCQELLDNDSSNLKDAQHFPINISTIGRLFPHWYAKKIPQRNFSPAEKSIFNVENIELLFLELLQQLYKFYSQFTALISSSGSKYLIEKLENLTTEDPLLPSSDKIEALLMDPRGYKLSELIKKYWEHSARVEKEIWPIPEVQEPPVPL